MIIFHNYVKLPEGSSGNWHDRMGIYLYISIYIISINMGLRKSYIYIWIRGFIPFGQLNIAMPWPIEFDDLPSKNGQFLQVSGKLPEGQLRKTTGTIVG